MPPKGAAVHMVPMLSPVLEEFVPLPFRGNVPDTPGDGGEQKVVPEEKRKELAVVAVESAPSPGSEDSEAKEETCRTRSRLVLTLQQWRKRAQRGLLQVTSKKPVQVQGMRRQKSCKSKSRTPWQINPLCLLARLRDSYIHAMNNAATSGAIAGGAPLGTTHESSTTSSFFSRECDDEAIAQLQRCNSSKPRSAAALSRSKTTRNPVDRSTSSLSSSKSGRRLSGDKFSRSKSVSISDEAFFSQSNKHRSRSKKMHVNPYADNKWAPVPVPAAAPKPMSGPVEFQFQRHKRTPSGSETKMRQGSFFEYR